MQLCAGERIWHCALPLLFAACALLALALLLRVPGAALVALLFSTAVWAPDSIFASWPATYLHNTAAATGSALINSVASIGGFLGPWITGYLEEVSGNLKVAVLVLAGATLVVAVLAACFPRHSKVPAAGMANIHEDEQTGFLGETESSA